MNGKNILVVEDNPIDMELMTNVLKRTGWHIVEARDGPSAQRLLRKSSRFRFACVDLSLPGMDGVHLVRWIKENYPHIAVAVVSGQTTDQQAAQLLDCGIVFLFPKPFTNRELQYLLNYMDTSEAIFNSARKLRPSWRTNLAGFVVIAAGTYVLLHSTEAKAIATGAAIIVTGAALLTAQDSKPIRELLEKLPGKKTE